MDKDLIKTWHRNGFTLRLYDLHKCSDGCHHELAYQFKDGHKIIFEGDDFGCSPLYAIDSIETVYGLLGFLCLKPGDTDAEYFDKYTPLQMAWCQSWRCDELALMVYDHENRKQSERR